MSFYSHFLVSSTSLRGVGRSGGVLFVFVCLFACLLHSFSLSFLGVVVVVVVLFSLVFFRKLFFAGGWGGGGVLRG